MERGFTGIGRNNTFINGKLMYFPIAKFENFVE